jgi:nucleoside phosphorylase
MKVDVAIITALKKELDAVLRQHDSWKTVRGKPKSIRLYHVTQNRAGHRIAAVQASSMGQLQAALVASDVLSDCSPKVILLVGIAAGIGKNINLGDVVVSEQLIDYELGKLTDSGEFPRFPVYQSNSALLASLRDFRDSSWTAKVKVPRPDGSFNTLPIVHPPGDVFCGNKVVADSQTITRLLNYFPKAIALEMESVGIASRLAQMGEPPHFAMIKGICDKGDPSKGDNWQEYAAEVAAAYATSFLDSFELIGAGTGFHPKSDHEIEEETAQIIDFVASDPISIQGHQHDLVKQIVKASLREVSDILSGRYQTNLSHGQQFLLRASALFGNASTIYATSLDTVSTFWTNPNNRAEAREYLRHQASSGNAMRLFVFSNSDIAHNYAKVLDWHERSYKNVFVCSMQKYQQILEEICGGCHPDQLINRDFAVLQYANQNIYRNLLAELDEKSLEYKEIDLDHPDEINYRAFIGLFDRYMRIERGQLDESSCVLRWQEGFWNDKERWVEILRKMFDERESDVIHMVAFKIEGKSEEQLREMFAEIKRKILINVPSGSKSMKVKYGIKNVWFGSRKLYEVRDYLHRGRLKMSDSNHNPYILILQFANEEGLQKFYEDREHADLRKKLYESFDSKFRILYEATQEGILASENGKQVAGEFIESMAKQYVSRYDYRNNEMIREMVMTTEPFSF